MDRLMDHNMYLLSLYFVLMGVSEQPGILNNRFLIRRTSALRPVSDRGQAPS